jgi:hypothetical protein
MGGEDLTGLEFDHRDVVVVGEREDAFAAGVVASTGSCSVGSTATSRWMLSGRPVATSFHPEFGDADRSVSGSAGDGLGGDLSTPPLATAGSAASISTGARLCAMHRGQYCSVSNGKRW